MAGLIRQISTTTTKCGRFNIPKEMDYPSLIRYFWSIDRPCLLEGTLEALEHILLRILCQ